MVLVASKVDRVIFPLLQVTSVAAAAVVSDNSKAVAKVLDHSAGAAAVVNPAARTAHQVRVVAQADHNPNTVHLPKEVKVADLVAHRQASLLLHLSNTAHQDNPAPKEEDSAVNKRHHLSNMVLQGLHQASVPQLQATAFQLHHLVISFSSDPVIF